MSEKHDAAVPYTVPCCDIAIVGMACVFPKAPDLETYWRNICSKVDAISDPTPGKLFDIFHDPDSKENDRTYCRRGGYLESLPAFNCLDFGIMPSTIDGAMPEQFLALKVAHDALVDAGFPDKPLNRDRTEVILARGIFINRGQTTLMQHGLFVDQTLRVLKELHPEYSDGDLQEIRGRLKSVLPPFNSENVTGVVDPIVSGMVSNRLDLKGKNLALDGACASGLLALEIAMQDLVLNKCDAALVGGVQATTPHLIHLIFTQVGALSRQAGPRPFSAKADGTMLGEGVGMLVLKRKADAVRDGNRIYAIVKGTGSASDGKGRGLMAPRMEGEATALRAAYESAGVSPRTVELIEAHGTAIPLGDETEVEALRTVFGGRNGGAATVALGSVKSMIGHLLPTAGIASLIKTALSLHHKTLPPTLHCEDPNPKLGLEKTPFYLNTETRPWIHGMPDSPRRAGINSFGFGGINAHAILEEHVSGNESAGPDLLRAWETELLVLAGQTREELLRQAGQVQALLQARGAEVTLKDLAYTLNASLADQPLRLAIVAESIADLGRKLEYAQRRLQDPACTRIKEKGGVFWFSEPLARTGDLAFLFPGEGSQYPNMLADLCLHFPEVRACFDTLDRAFAGQAGRLPPSQCIFPIPSPGAQPADTGERLWQMDYAVDAVLAADRALFLLFSMLGIKPSAMLGHSSGEILAIEAAGALKIADEEERIRHIRTGNTMIRSFAENQALPDAPLIAVGVADPQPVLDFVRENPGKIFMAMDNCPNQLVLCCRREVLSSTIEKLKTLGAMCQVLPFARPYHTELFQPAEASIKAFFDQFTIRAPTTPLYSCITAAPMPSDPAEIRRLTVAQWASKVRFQDTIHALYDAGTRLFVELGPRANLTGFVADILKKKPALAVAANVHYRSGITQLHHTLGLLAAHGVAMNLKPLYARRNPVTIDFKADAGHPKSLQVALTSDIPMIRLGQDWVNAHPHLHTHNAAPAPAAAPAVNAGPFEEYFQTMERFLETQQQIMAAMLGVAPALPAGAIAQPLAQLPPVAPAPLAIPTPPAVAAPATPAAAPAAAVLSRDSIHKRVLDVISEKTGYPADMLTPEQTLEADLGIDSIKRVEILREIRLKVAEHGIQIEAGGLSDCKTLREITDRISSIAPATPTAPVVAPPPATPAAAHAAPAAAALSRDSVHKRVLDVISEKTGYPADMLTPEQTLEADLGIDSIKRVEILREIRLKVAEHGIQIEAGGLSDCKTLREITDRICTKMPAGLTAPDGSAQLRPPSHTQEPRESAIGGRGCAEPSSQAAPQPMPMVRQVVHYVPGSELRAVSTFDIAEDIFLLDHTIGREISVTDPELFALPIMPLTMSIEIMAEGAAMLMPGKVCVRLQELRGYRWIQFDKPQVQLAVHARCIAPDTVRVQIREGATASQERPIGLPIAEGTIVFAARHPEPPALKPFQLRNGRPSSITPERLYTDGMFTGPRFQGVASVDEYGDDGNRGVLRTVSFGDFLKSRSDTRLITDPVVLDGAGQMVAYWVMESRGLNHNSFPYRIEQVLLYGPNAPAGTLLPCSAPASMISETQVRGNFDVFLPDGRLWMQVIGWEDRTFPLPEDFHRLRCRPREVYSSTPWPGPVACLPRKAEALCRRMEEYPDNLLRDYGKVWINVLAFLTLSRRERATWDQLPNLERRRIEFLLGRVTVKDTVRQYVKEHTGRDFCLTDIELDYDSFGRPILLEGPWSRGLPRIPSISLTHKEGMAAAMMCASAAPCGIDVERVDTQTRDLHDAILTEAEQRILIDASLPLDREWQMRIWSAKEAAGKACGRGLPSGPQDLVLRAVDAATGAVTLEVAGRLKMDLPAMEGRRLKACTHRDGPIVAACMVIETERTAKPT